MHKKEISFATNPVDKCGFTALTML